MTNPKIAFIYSKELEWASDLLPSSNQRHKLTNSLIAAFNIQNLHLIPPTKAKIQDLLECHSEPYITLFSPTQHLSNLQEFGLTEDCPIFPNIQDHILYTSGASLTAAKCLLRGYKTAINWTGGRHHATHSSASGFCYINDIAVSIHLLHTRFKRILYVDVDVHHGDGVEQYFAFSGRICCLSFHLYEAGFFPGSGSVEQVGFGKGRYCTINVPLLQGCGDETFCGVFERVVGECLERFEPECIVLQCGCDGLANDPLGGWNLSSETIAKCVSTLTNTDIPLLILGGGGYDPINTAKCWTLCTLAATKTPFTNEIPEHQNWPLYKPDFELIVKAGYMKDHNLENDYIDRILHQILENIKQIKK